MKKWICILITALLVLGFAAQAEDCLVFIPGMEQFSYGRFDKSYQLPYGDMDLYGYVWDYDARDEGYEYAEDFLMMLLDRGDFEIIAGYTDVHRPGDTVWYLYCYTLPDYSRFQYSDDPVPCHLQMYHCRNGNSYNLEIAACDGIIVED